jgi:hypothetical protein
LTDTVRTTAALQTLLSDGAAAHSTNRQLLRDVVASFDVTRSRVISVKDAPYLAVGDGVADDTTKLQAAIDAAAALTNGGTVSLLGGTYKTTATLNVPLRVSIVGVSPEASIIAPVNCDGIALGVGTDLGGVKFEDFSIQGSSCTTRTAFKSMGTATSSDWTTGVHVARLRVTDYQTAMRFRNLHQSTIRECWFQRINIGINYSGQNIANRIYDNTMIFAGGCGSGTKTGIIVDAASDYNPGGNTTLVPESCHITGNFVYGFEQDIELLNGTYVNVLDNDLEAIVKGITFASINAVLNIKNNHIEMSGASGTHAIHGLGLSSIIDSKYNIEGNTAIATATVSSYGLQLNVFGVNQNQTNVRIAGNKFSGYTLADIYMSGAGDVNIEDNHCFSPIGSSIQVFSALSQRPIYIDKNRCAGRIYVEPTANAAQVYVGANHGLFSTRIRGNSTITNGNTTVTTTYASLGAATKNFDTTANSGLKQKLFLGTPDKNIGAVWGTADATQVVITCGTASVGSTVIPWEVKAYQSNV